MWADKEAAFALGHAARRMSNDTILTPGLGDVSTLVHKSWAWAAIAQFKSFVSAHTGHVLMKGLQEKDAKTLMGLSTAILLGYTSYAIKQKLAKKEVDTSWEAIVENGVAQSGLLGLIGTYYGFLSPQYNSERYGGKDMITNAFGPSAGMAAQIYNAVDASVNKPMDAITKQKLLSTMPFANVFYLRSFLEKAVGVSQESIKEAKTARRKAGTKKAKLKRLGIGDDE
jgi:hypothetical protein